jgi:hypothetical protein
MPAKEGKWYYCVKCLKTVSCVKDGDGNWVCRAKHIVLARRKRIRG